MLAILTSIGGWDTRPRLGGLVHHEEMGPGTVVNIETKSKVVVLFHGRKAVKSCHIGTVKAVRFSKVYSACVSGMARRLRNTRNRKCNARVGKCMRGQIMNGFLGAPASARSHGVMVSTLDFESSDPSSSLGGTSFFIFTLTFFFSLYPSYLLLSLFPRPETFIFILKLPVLGFRVDQLPMSETVMGVWTSLVRLSGPGGRVAAAAMATPPSSGASNIQSLTCTRPVRKFPSDG